jgi:hypothetical protein
VQIYGVDFTCAPCRRKPITVAAGSASGNTLAIEQIEKLETFADFERFLARPGPWIGGFDFPFSLSRELVRDLGWPQEWKNLVAHCAGIGRLEFRAALDTYRNSRPIGSKYAHRATDLPAGSSSPMKLVNPPVALMFHEGARRIMGAGVHVPGLATGDISRTALEAYPGLLVRKQLGIRESYKSDTRCEQTRLRTAVRLRIVEALREARPLGIAVKFSDATGRALVRDGSGDALDAVICAAQAQWAWVRRQRNFGLPNGFDALEGWIVSALADEKNRVRPHFS